MIDRRRFVGGLALGCVVAPVALRAQPVKIPRIGILIVAPLDTPEVETLLDAIRQGLRERGYVDGQNIFIEYRTAGGRPERLPGLADELVRLKVDVICVGNPQAIRVAQQATTTVPIVAFTWGDPVEDGLVASLARPGGNVTGLTYLGSELVPKRLELIKELLPAVSRVAVLRDLNALGPRATSNSLSAEDAAAGTMGLQLQRVGVRAPTELDGAFSAIARERTDALVVLPSNFIFLERSRAVAFAAKQRLPSIFFAREFVQSGGLISYGPSVLDLYRRVALYVDKILKGAKPGDLPFEQSTQFELVINLKTALELGLKVPQSLLVRADDVIQ